MTILARVLLTGFIGFGVAALLGGVGVWGMKSGSKALEEVYQLRVTPMMRIQEIERDLKEIRFRMAGVLLDQLPTVGSRRHLQSARNTITEHWLAFHSISDTTSDEQIKPLVEKATAAIQKLPALLDKLDAAYNSDDNATIRSILEEEWPVFHSGLIKPLGALLPILQAQVKQTYETNAKHVTGMLSVSLLVLTAGLLLITVSVLFLTRSITSGVKTIQNAMTSIAAGNLTASIDQSRSDEIGNIAKSLTGMTEKLTGVIRNVHMLAKRVDQSAIEVSEKAMDVSHRNQTVSDAITRVSTASEEIGAASGHVVEAATDAESSARSSATLAISGNENMAKSLEVANAMGTVVASSSETVNKLSTSIQQIGQIAVVIKGIADQTNLLALNAAIEAARAGEQGRGFAVVADEVRKLAKRTTSSTAEIAVVIDSIRTETEQAVEAMQAVRLQVEDTSRYNQATDETLGAIVSAVEQAALRVRGIVDSAKEQTVAIDDISRQIADIATQSEQNSANARDVNNAAHTMNSMATQLRESVGYFQI